MHKVCINMYLLFTTITHHERQVSQKHTFNGNCYMQGQLIRSWLLLSAYACPDFQNYHPSLGHCVSVFPVLTFHWNSMDSFKPVISQCYLQSFNSCRRLIELFSVFLIFQQIFLRIWISKNRNFLSNAGKEPSDGNAQWAAVPVGKNHQQALWKGKQGVWWKLGPRG